MTDAWPGGLPQSPLLQGYSESPPDVALRTPMDGGVAKLRRRFTAATRPLQWAMICTKAQVATLDTFYSTTLVGGTLPFTFDHPRTTDNEEFRFIAPPVYVVIGSEDEWRVSVSLEQLP